MLIFHLNCNDNFKYIIVFFLKHLMTTNMLANNKYIYTILLKSSINLKETSMNV